MTPGNWRFRRIMATLEGAAFDARSDRDLAMGGAALTLAGSALLAAVQGSLRALAYGLCCSGLFLVLAWLLDRTAHRLLARAQEVELRRAERAVERADRARIDRIIDGLLEAARRSAQRRS